MSNRDIIFTDKAIYKAKQQFEIVPGKFYRTRNGDKVCILEYNPASQLPWTGVIRQLGSGGTWEWFERTWREDGGYNTSPLLTSECDLVSPWSERYNPTSKTTQAREYIGEWISKEVATFNSAAKQAMEDAIIYGEGYIKNAWFDGEGHLTTKNSAPEAIRASKETQEQEQRWMEYQGNAWGKTNIKKINREEAVAMYPAHPSPLGESLGTTLMRQAKCECGATKCGHLIHSTWCPLHV
jgi:hypothetical protein